MVLVAKIGAWDGGGDPGLKFLSQNDPPTRDFQGAVLSGGSEPVELKKNCRKFRLFRLGRFYAQKGKMSHHCGVSSELLKYFL